MRPLIALAALALAAPLSAGQDPRPAYERELERLYRRPLNPQERELIRAPMSDAERFRLYQQMWKWGDEHQPVRHHTGEVSPREVYAAVHSVPDWGWGLALAGMVALSRPRRKKPE